MVELEKDEEKKVTIAELSLNLGYLGRVWFIIKPRPAMVEESKSPFATEISRYVSIERTKSGGGVPKLKNPPVIVVHDWGNRRIEHRRGVSKAD